MGVGAPAAPSMNALVRALVESTLRPYLKWRAMAAAADWDISDINLVAYPKSGVSWMSLVLANILARRSPGNRRVDLFSVSDFVPDLHANAQRLLTLEPPRILKTHERFEEWSARVALKGRGRLFPRVIYLLRDGRDVMASQYAHQSALSGRPVTPEAFYGEQSSTGQDWATHVREWVVDDNGLDRRGVLIVRYEDARENPSETFGRVAEFIGLDVQPNLLAQAIECSSAPRIRALEDRFGDGVRYQNPDYRFTGDGRRAEQTDAVDRVLAAYRTDHQRVFEQVGY